MFNYFFDHQHYADDGGRAGRKYVIVFQNGGPH